LSGPDGRSKVAGFYLRVAGTLERSAQLAERDRSNSRPDWAAVELERARRAREADRRGRALAARMQ